MAKKKLTDEELEKLKQIKEANKALQDLILLNTEALNPAQAKARDLKKEKELIDLIGADPVSIYSIKQFNKLLLKRATKRDITFINKFYDNFFILTGIKKDEKNPHWKPFVFALFTIKYIYRRFRIKNLMDELRNRNPFLTGEMFREFKHYQFFNDEYYKQLIEFINDVTEMQDECLEKGLAMYQFDVKYCKKYNLLTDTDLFYKA